MPTLTVAQNVELPLRLAGRRPQRGRVQEIVERVGLGGRIRHRPFELSGGERQRVAIARALIAEPGRHVRRRADRRARHPRRRRGARAAARVGARGGQTVVMVTHDPVAAAYAERVVFLADGRIVDELRRADAPSASPSADRADGLRACPV